MMEKLYQANGAQTEAGTIRKAPDIPEAVKATCKGKGIQYDNLTYNFLCRYWYPLGGWKGMHLGIEPDGYAHT